jgi:hypothetical protein
MSAAAAAAAAAAAENTGGGSRTDMHSKSDATQTLQALHPLAVDQLKDLLSLMRDTSSVADSSGGKYAVLPNGELDGLRRENAALKKELAFHRMRVTAHRNKEEVGKSTRERLSKVEAQLRTVDLLKQKDDMMVSLLSERDNEILRLERKVRELSGALTAGGLLLESDTKSGAQNLLE